MVFTQSQSVDQLSDLKLTFEYDSNQNKYMESPVVSVYLCIIFSLFLLFWLISKFFKCYFQYRSKDGKSTKKFNIGLRGTRTPQTSDTASSPESSPDRPNYYEDIPSPLTTEQDMETVVISSDEENDNDK